MIKPIKGSEPYCIEKIKEARRRIENDCLSCSSKLTCATYELMLATAWEDWAGVLKGIELQKEQLAQMAKEHLKDRKSEDYPGKCPYLSNKKVAITWPPIKLEEENNEWVI